MIDKLKSRLADVPASVWIFVITQFILFIVWVVRIDSRVDTVELRQKENVAYLARIEQQTREISLLHERQTRTQQQIDILVQRKP